MSKPRRDAKPQDTEATDLRIIGGRFRGSKLRYEVFRSGDDPITRPMKHRVREAIFNLVSDDVTGRHAIDLFAGTGALGLEALSRGALAATFIERHVPTARVIEDNIKALGVEAQSTVVVTSAFLWVKRRSIDLQSDIAHLHASIHDASSGNSAALTELPWLVFCSPPFDFFVDRAEEMLSLTGLLMDLAPEGSVLIYEADGRFDFATLPKAAEWDVRPYFPAVVGVWRKAARGGA